MKGQTSNKNGRAGRARCALLVALVTPLLFSPSVQAQTSWLNPEDGEILNVSSADGPASGQPFLQVRRSYETSSPRGQVLINRLRFQYGINDFASVGASGVHLHQWYHGFEKKGLGDTHINLKLYFQPDPNLHLRLGLRQSLSIPTGYEKERDGLAPFTSRQNEYSAVGLLQYVNPRFSAYLNPGVLLPGGKGNTCFTGGFGLAFTLPFRFDLRGEYYTRWDVVERRSASEIYAGARSPLLRGLSVQFGMKRRLLQNELVDPEYQLGFCFGRDRKPDAEAYSVPVRRTETALLIHPIETMVPDPTGVARRLTEVFRTDRSGGEDRLVLYVRSYPSDQVEELIKVRHYVLNVRILEINQGNVGGLDLSPVLRWTRSSTEIVAQAEFLAPDGYTVLRRAVYRGLSSKSLGVVLAPDHGSQESVVTPDEVIQRLRESALTDLSVQILRDVVQVMNERDQQ